MCIYSDKLIELSTANEDINIFKIVDIENGMLKSPYHKSDIEWKINEINHSEIGVEYKFRYETTTGLYSYFYTQYQLYTIFKVITSYYFCSRNKEDYGKTWAIYKGVIPKGSNYYIEPFTNEIVSNNLMLTEMIDYDRLGC